MNNLPVLKISKYIQARFQDVFVIKDITLLEDNETLWHFELVIAGPFEEFNKKIIVKKDAFTIWNCLEEGLKWSS